MSLSFWVKPSHSASGRAGNELLILPLIYTHCANTRRADDNGNTLSSFYVHKLGGKKARAQNSAIFRDFRLLCPADVVSGRVPRALQPGNNCAHCGLTLVTFLRLTSETRRKLSAIWFYKGHVGRCPGLCRQGGGGGEMEGRGCLYMQDDDLATIVCSSPLGSFFLKAIHNVSYTN